MRACVLVCVCDTAWNISANAHGHCHVDILAVALDSAVFYVYNFPLIAALDIVCVRGAETVRRRKEGRESASAGEVMWKDEGG